MGQTLSEPVTSKQSSSCEDQNFKVGSSNMQGWRINMEDAHTHILSLNDDRSAAFFAVFDGHGGAKVAQYAGEHLHTKVVNQTSYASGEIAEAIKRAFLELDEDMLNDEEMKDELAGTTACVVILKDGKIYSGNVGDSRALASVAGDVQQLSFDHKPSNDEEARRITAAGGWIEFNRVNGNLALSRALGDFVFKRNEKKCAEEQIVTACPDVLLSDITQDHEFLVLACDGIWDVLSNQEVIDFVRSRIADGLSPKQICEELMMRCLAPDCQMGGLGCDNMTVVLVTFLHGGTYEQLQAKCARPKRLDAHLLEAMRPQVAGGGGTAGAHGRAANSVSSTTSLNTSSRTSHLEGGIELEDGDDGFSPLTPPTPHATVEPGIGHNLNPAAAALQQQQQPIDSKY